MTKKVFTEALQEHSVKSKNGEKKFDSSKKPVCSLEVFVQFSTQDEKQVTLHIRFDAVEGELSFLTWPSSFKNHGRHSRSEAQLHFDGFQQYLV